VKRRTETPAASVPDDAMSGEIVRATGDAVLVGYRVEFDRVVLDLRLWDDRVEQLPALGLNLLVDDRTHEVDAIVRVPDLDSSDGRRGWGVVDSDAAVTVRFRALQFDRRSN
jgi:hypothetical protein